TLADHLIQRGELDADQRSAIDAMVKLHLKKNGDDPQKSLAALPVGNSTRERLGAIGDPDLTASVARMSDLTEPDADQTGHFSVGAATSDGQRFRVLRPHARGGLGAVFVALDGELNREVALKQIHEQYAHHIPSRRRFVVEAEITGGLEHPGIVPVYGLGTQNDGRPYYAMRFIRGDNLKQAIEAFHNVVSATPNQSVPVGSTITAPPEQSTSSNASKSKRSAIADPPKSLLFRNLLRRFTDVCNAIDYAHARGVLHRDIKPGNIIIGKYGETLVVDWGLAKSLGRREIKGDPEERTLVPSSASGTPDTRPGSILGTPAYMSPEQARGDLDALGVRSDVYSLGATLYSLLTGQAPFSGPLEILLRDVQGGAFERPREHYAAIDPALEAVCLKAMALKPEDRYESARALAEDVDRWLADEPVTAYPEPFTRRARRWAKRNRTAVSGATVALVMLVVGLGGFSVFQTRANTRLDFQRQRAENREQLAIDAVKRFADSVAENPELKNNMSLEELRKTLLKEPLEFFKSLRERLQADRDTRPESLARLAKAGSELGFLTIEIGDKQDAITAYRESLAIFNRLARENPSIIQFQTDLATIHLNLGNLLSDIGQAGAAREALGRALAIWERLARENPAIIRFQSDLATSHNALGRLLQATGQLGTAREALERALAIREHLARENPAITQYQSQLAISHHSLGLFLNATGQALEARASYERALAIRERLAREHPAIIEFQSGLASSNDNLGNLLMASGQATAAQAAYERSLVIQERLARENPAITEFQRDLAASHNNLGALLGETGQAGAARESFDRALAIQERLTQDYPRISRFQSDLAGTHTNLGLLLSETGQMGAAVEANERALVIWERLAREHPTIIQFQHRMAANLYTLGTLHSATGQPAAAQEFHERALAILEGLAREHPAVPEFKSDLAASHNNLGMLLHDAGQAGAARESYERALAIREGLARENPEIAVYLSDLAASHNNLGILLRDAGQAGAARESYERALAIWERLAREHPESPEYASDLGATLNNLAMIDLNARRFAEAHAGFLQAVDWQKRALAANPRNPTYRRYLGNHLTNLITAARGLGREDEAAAAQRELAALKSSDPQFEALDARLIAVSQGAPPKDVAERLALAQRAYEIARHALAARLWAEAMKDDPRLADNRQAQHAYNAACSAALAGCSQGTEDPALDDAAKARLRQRARSWLTDELAEWTRVLDSGSDPARDVVAQTLAHWNQDPDLAGLRDAKALEALPDDERVACRDLWAKVDALLARARGEAPLPDLPEDPFTR
ncbi:MAG: tetratricopeptide repeat protein, partial [Isosphaeraceae bacterium]